MIDLTPAQEDRAQAVVIQIWADARALLELRVENSAQASAVDRANAFNAALVSWVATLWAHVERVNAEGTELARKAGEAVAELDARLRHIEALPHTVQPMEPKPGWSFGLIK